MFIYAGSFGGNTLPLTFNNSGHRNQPLKPDGSYVDQLLQHLHNLHGATLTMTAPAQACSTSAKAALRPGARIWV